ncbi:PorP/SprF family type IX secretion system membrane protein [Cecembia calidifontis]|jgi:type IX secretion system PorP/SprF family membrane protein|uniref:Type IX secretion system PorP/SprF family membrane protein n=1 Tax=Cecembia calidifontis TaxID=1187080 RepID=A0A4Q7P565_9BACT|nr:type IX secretion system membrane protein PorP/SprF [Cecembia calidifontis]RZS95156.1 type IX secretion system PorP/SprF family membrane protein [Cecembia calidifontis]
MKKLLLCFSFLVIASFGKAQDIQFSQFYAAPIYLNPAFAGSSEMTRFGVNFRNQWPGLEHSLNAYSAYFDHYFFNLNSGIGLIVNGMNETVAGLSTTEVGLAYSYRVQLGFNSFLRFGGQASFFSRDANMNQFIFESQIDRGTGSVGDQSGELLGLDSRHRYVDYHFGMLFNNEFGWLGLSAHHITQPNISFIDDQISRWPMKISAHGGLKFDLSGGSVRNFMNNSQGQRELVLAFNYKHQDPFNQLDLGAQFNLQPVVFGLWYRGLPNLGNALPNNESLIGLVGFSLGNGLDIGYSYDFTLSPLGQANTGGAHEVSMRLSFLSGDAKQAGRKGSILPCFKY